MGPETSSEQYSPVDDDDTERYLDSKGGAGKAKPGRASDADKPPTDEEVRHAAEVGNEAKRQQRDIARKQHPEQPDTE
ncbi:MAG: hypothetical protein JWO59_3064 [Chloroflexi bacterium]|jgi:hypothetical protein|nr:hypothetical protein [Chloroflexota bacterium]MDB5077976.1 hypothetical protein [Chloroflexota bacterium]